MSMTPYWIHVYVFIKQSGVIIYKETKKEKKKKIQPKPHSVVAFEKDVCLFFVSEVWKWTGTYGGNSLATSICT